MTQRITSLLKTWFGRRRPLPAAVLPFTSRVPAPGVLRAVGNAQTHGDDDSTTPEKGSRPQSVGSHSGNGEAVGKIAAQFAQLLTHHNSELADHLTREMREHQTLVQQRLDAMAEKFEHSSARKSQKLTQFLQALVRRDVHPLADRVSAAARQDAAENWAVLRKQVVETCSATTHRAAQRPAIDQLIALFDRIRDEGAFLGAWYRKDPDLSLHVGCRELQKRHDAAVRSFAAEILMILRSLGVEVIEGVAGSFNPQIQRVVGVETAPRPGLDGHVARVVRAGFSWNGTILRSEQVIVFKKENK